VDVDIDLDDDFFLLPDADVNVDDNFFRLLPALFDKLLASGMGGGCPLMFALSVVSLEQRGLVGGQ
jgi:hypothetical protein